MRAFRSAPPMKNWRVIGVRRGRTILHASQVITVKSYGPNQYWVPRSLGCMKDMLFADFRGDIWPADGGVPFSWRAKGGPPVRALK